MSGGQLQTNWNLFRIQPDGTMGDMPGTANVERIN
jgi:hypothetical protein